MEILFLDCTEEQSELRDVPNSRRVWLADELSETDWVVPVNYELASELATLANFIESNPLASLQRHVQDFGLPACRAAMQAMKSILDHGVGFTVLDKLPIDQYSEDTLVEIYWLLGQLVGRPVAQKWNGQMMYHVTDTGADYSYGVRGSHTAVELLFHTDNAFAKMVPDYVGLLCKHPAKQGGISRFCSLYAVHERMRARYPELLKRLYLPMLFDRQKEHHEGAPRVCFAPYFSWKDDRLNARANSSLVRKGYDVAQKLPDTMLGEALDAIDEVCASDDLWFEAPLQRGQIQYLNNHEVGHYRSAFVDHDDPEQKRHLIRLWHRDRGGMSYDGGIL